MGGGRDHLTNCIYAWYKLYYKFILIGLFIDFLKELHFSVSVKLLSWFMQSCHSCTVSAFVWCKTTLSSIHGGRDGIFVQTVPDFPRFAEFNIDHFIQPVTKHRILCIIFVEMDDSHRLFLQCFIAKSFMSEQETKDTYCRCSQAFGGKYFLFCIYIIIYYIKKINITEHWEQFHKTQWAIHLISAHPLSRIHVLEEYPPEEFQPQKPETLGNSSLKNLNPWGILASKSGIPEEFQHKKYEPLRY